MIPSGRSGARIERGARSLCVFNLPYAVAARLYFRVCGPASDFQGVSRKVGIYAY